MHKKCNKKCKVIQFKCTLWFDICVWLYTNVFEFSELKSEFLPPCYIITILHLAQWVLAHRKRDYNAGNQYISILKW